MPKQAQPADIADRAAQVEAAFDSLARADIPGWPTKVCAVWPALRAALRIAKLFVDDQTDGVIDELISTGDGYCADDS